MTRSCGVNAHLADCAKCLKYSTCLLSLARTEVLYRTMPFRRKQPQAVAEIRLDPPHSDAKAESSFWLTNETIHGHAVYTFPNGLEFTNSKVVLKGETIREIVVEECLMLIFNQIRFC